jgi:CBS domain-containing protein
MLVRDVMRRSPASCAPGTNLAAVTEQLWACGCGALPVVDAAGKVLGIITDRDICVALGTRDRRPSEITAEQAMSRAVAACRTDDDIHEALHMMGSKKVRRLPVLDRAGKLEGLLSMSDLILDARHGNGTRPELSYEDVMTALRAIYWHATAVMPAVHR